MKQHITPKQAQEMSEEQFYTLFDEIVRRKDWHHFHHRKVTAVKILENLKEITIKNSDSGEWVVNHAGFISRGEELVDALWNALLKKFYLESERKGIRKGVPSNIKGLSRTHEGLVGNCPKCSRFVSNDTDIRTCTHCGEELFW